MRIGIAISEQDERRVVEDLRTELMLHHKVDELTLRRTQAPIFYERVNRYLRRHTLGTFMANHDVVFFDWASDLLADATHLPKRSPIVTRLHRYEMFSWVSRINWSAVDKVILLSEAMRAKFTERCPGQMHKTVVVPWGVSTTKFQAVSREFHGNIGTMCELIPRKRVFELILAFYQLLQGDGGLHLHIGGTPSAEQRDYYDALQSLVKKLCLQDHITFYGRVTDTPSWYRQLDIFVSNSYSEGSQAALLEAMATGCYCLAQHWDGAEELLSAEYLFFTDNDLCNKIAAFCDASDSVRRQYQDALRAIVCERHDVRQIVPQVRGIIEQAASDGAVAGRHKPGRQITVSTD